MEPITRKARYITESSISLGEAVGAQFDQAITENPTVAAFRMAELGFADGEKISHEQARQMVKDAGLNGQLEISSVYTPTKDYTNLLIERKQDEIRRRDLMTRAPTGPVASTSMFATAFLASMLDPVNIGASFVPVAGELRWARTAMHSRSALTRLAGRGAVGAIEGATGAALVEPIIFASKKQEQADYELADSFLNVVFGAAFGAGLHTSFGAIGDVYRDFHGIKQPFERPEKITQEDVIDAIRKKDSGVSRETAVVMADQFIHDTKVRAGLIERGEAQKTADTISVEEAEHIIRTGIGQLMDGRDLDIDPLLSHYAKQMQDGTRVRDLSPDEFVPKKEELPDLMRKDVAKLDTRIGMPDPKVIEGSIFRRAQILFDAQRAIEANKELTPQHIEAMRQAKVAQAIQEGLPVPERFMVGNEKFEPVARRNRLNHVQSEVKARQVQKPVEATQSVSPEKTAEIKSKQSPVDSDISAIENEIAEIEAESKALEDRLDVKIDDPEYAEAVKGIDLAARWSDIAENVQLCITRGG